MRIGSGGPRAAERSALAITGAFFDVGGQGGRRYRKVALKR